MQSHARRAAVVGALGLDPKKTRAALYPHVAKDPDALVRQLAMIAMVGDPEGPLPITLPAMADRAGNIYIADKNSHSVLRVSTNGTIHTHAGTHEGGFNGEGPAAATNLSHRHR